MTDDHMIRAAVLGFAAVFMAWYLIVQNRGALATLFRHAAMWVLIFGTIVVGFSLWTDTSFGTIPRQATFASDGRIEIPRGIDGHYHATLDINGVPVPFVVDTGASDVVLSRQDAQRIGIDLDNMVFTGIANTANGQVKTAKVRLEQVELGDIRDTYVPAVVNNGEMRGSLLGMSYLNRFDHIEITDGKLVLTR